MKKYLNLNVLLFLGLFLFLTINTSYFWERNIGVAAIIIFGFLLILYVILLFAVFTQLIKLLKSKNRIKKRYQVTIILCLVLITIGIAPKGIIKFEKFESPNILIARSEGGAGCITSLSLKENKKFRQKTSCFGLSETTGNYRISEDTIRFYDVSLGINATEFYDYAVIKKYSIEFYKDNIDSISYHMKIEGNTIK